MKLIALTVMLLICTGAQATEPKQQGSAAWAITIARQKLTTTAVQVKKACTCSSQCVCGCNTGGPCTCGKTSKAESCRLINGVWVCPNR